MSKTSQRKVSAKALSKIRYLEGKAEARRMANAIKGGVNTGFYYYPNCMAWRKGWLQAGGHKFWSKP